MGFPAWNTADPMPSIYSRFFRLMGGNDLLERLSALYTCCNLLGRVGSTLPIDIVQSDGNISVPVNSYIRDLLQQPNEYMDKVVFLETMFLSFNLYGNAYAEVVQINNRVTALWPLPYERVTPRWNNRNLSYAIALPSGQTVELPSNPDGPDSSYVIHVRNFSRDGIHGISPLRLYAMRNADAGSEFSEAFLKNGAFPSIVITTPDNPDEAAQKRLRDTADSVYSGPSNVGKILFAFKNSDIKTVSLSPADAQLLESMKEYKAEIAAAYGVPVFLLNGGQTPTFASAEQFNRNFVDYAIRPLCIRFATAFSAALLNQRLRQQIKFNLDALIEGDSKTKIENLGIAVDKALMTRNEARAKLNLPPLPGGDVLITQSNQTTLELIENPPEPKPVPVNPPAPKKYLPSWR
jgi:HK97 family phage portal protein